MTYKEFNQQVFDYYLLRTNSSFISLSIDSSEIKKMVEIEKLKKFTDLKLSWDILLEDKKDLPQYFGLIAIQCLAASEMQEGGGWTEVAYRPRLKDLLGLEDVSQLQTLCVGYDYNKPIQERIWNNAKAYLKDKFNLTLNIPRETFGPKRYTQYPIYQSLLNVEDLKSFTLFFFQEFEVNEEIPFNYFKKKLDESFYNIEFTTRTRRLWQEGDKWERCLGQLFNYYNSWDGEAIARSNHEKQLKKDIEKRKGKSKIKISDLILIFENGIPTFKFLDRLNGQSLIEVGIHDLEVLTNNNDGFIILSKSDYYDNEYEYSRFIYPSQEAYILLTAKTPNAVIYKYFSQTHNGYISISSVLDLYRFRLKAGTPNQLKDIFLQRDKSVKLNGGLKTSRSNTYLRGYGPEVLCSTNYTILSDNKKIAYSTQLSPEGKYIVRVEYCKDLWFELVELNNASAVEQQSTGWNLTNYSVDENYDFQGTIMKNSLSKENPIRIWINENLQKQKLQCKSSKMFCVLNSKV